MLFAFSTRIVHQRVTFLAWFQLSSLLLSGPVYAAAPANNDFANAQIITQATGSFNGTNLGATKETSEPDHAGDAGGASIWYRWTAPSALSMALSTAGSLASNGLDPLDTVLAVYTGTQLSNLEEVASDDEGNEDGTSRLLFIAEAGVDYHIAVDGYEGAVGSIVLAWQTSPANDYFDFPQLLAGTEGSLSGQNTGAGAEQGEPAHADEPPARSLWFAWTAIGHGTVTFSTGGSEFDTLLAVYTGFLVDQLTLIANNDDTTNTTSTLGFDAQPGEQYLIALDGRAEGAFNLSWVLDLLPPANDNFAAAKMIAGPAGESPGSLLGATSEPAEPDHGAPGGGRSVWFRWTAPLSDRFTFHTHGSAVDTLLTVYTGESLEALNPVDANDDYALGVTSQVEFDAVPGTAYSIAVDARQAGDILLTWFGSNLAAANDAFANAEPIAGQAGNVTAVTLLASREPSEPLHAATAGGRSVWYSWTSAFSVRIGFTTAGSNFDTLLSVYQGTELASLATIAGNNDAPEAGDSSSHVEINAQGGTTYHIAIDGVNGAGGTASLRWAPVLPQISSVTPGTGPAGTAVTLQGKGFFGATNVTFNGVAAGFAVNSDDRISVVVPGSALTGNIQVRTAVGSALSPEPFSVPLPLLTIQKSETGPVVVSWPLTPSGFVLQSSTTPALAGWANQVGSFGLANGQRHFTNTSPDSLRAFRLRR